MLIRLATLIVIGLVLSIPLIIFGSQILLKVLTRYPVLVTLGAALLGWIGGEVMITDDSLHHLIDEYGHNLEYAAAAAGAVFVVVVGTILARRQAAKVRHVEDLSVEKP